MQDNVIDSSAHEIPLPVSLAVVARQLGRSTVTLWRWQKRGWLDASINIAGRPYLTREAIDRFTRRATAGEFSQAPHAPRRGSSVPQISPSIRSRRGTTSSKSKQPVNKY